MNATRVRHVILTMLAAGAISAAVAPGTALAQAQRKQQSPTAAQPAREVTLEKVTHTGDLADQEDLVGKKAKDFTLTDTEGKEHTLSNYLNDGKVVVLEWFNPTCPYVVKHHKTHRTMSDLASEFEGNGVVWLAVNSGARDTAEKNQKAREDWKVAYPVLLDAQQDVGRAYGSKNTPTMYVIDKDGVIRYVGAIDSDSHHERLGEINYVRQALEAVLAGSNVETGYAKPYGCSVKYPRG